VLRLAHLREFIRRQLTNQRRVEQPLLNSP
jgi:hypothetical protein